MSILSDLDRISAALEAVEGGKADIAEAITAKGVDTLPDSSFDTLAANIGLIDGGGGVAITRGAAAKKATLVCSTSATSPNSRF